MLPRTRARLVAVALLPALALFAGSAGAQDSEAELIVLTWHKVSGTPLDFEAVAATSPTVRNASSFDRPDAQRAEVARLRALLNSLDPRREFVTQVLDRVQEYDHAKGEFPIHLFQSGTAIDLHVYEVPYRLVFANAAHSRAIRMPKETARALDQRLEAINRNVTNEVRYRIIGAGDPTGAVPGPRVMLAELLSSRLIDRQGGVMHVVDVRPHAPARAAGGVAQAGAGHATLDARAVSRLDVAGLRVGVKADDLAATLRRLFGPAVRRPARAADRAQGLVEVLALNELRCVVIPGRRAPAPGDVCVTAQVDGDGVVRMLRVERVFPPMDPEVFRRSMVAKYGPVAAAVEDGGYALGWGPEVPAALRYAPKPGTALTAHYLANDTFMSRSANARPQIRVVLHLVDAAWAESRAR